MRYEEITYVDVNNGLGCRVTLWISGCTHHCVGCHNKGTWSFNSGKIYDTKDEQKLFSYISLPYIKGLTLSGGEPLDSAIDVIALCERFKQKFPDKDIWLYSGYTIEQIKNDKTKSEILKYIDYLVDGEFKHKLKDITLAFRGSSNQNIWKKNENNGEFERCNLD